LRLLREAECKSLAEYHFIVNVPILFVVIVLNVTITMGVVRLTRTLSPMF
jgi:hypothetical protein